MTFQSSNVYIIILDLKLENPYEKEKIEIKKK